MCWIWVPSVFCGEFQDDFTPLCPVVVRDAPLHLPQTARRCWDPVQGGFSSVSSAGSEHHTPSGIQMEKECSKCSHSVAILPFQWNKSEKLQSSQHILLHVWVPQPVPARGLSGISPGSRSIVLPFSIPNSWDTCSPATHLPLITEFISLEKRMAELIPVQGSDPAALCNLCSCSSGSAHLPCTFCVLGAEGGGWKEELFTNLYTAIPKLYF